MELVLYHPKYDELAILYKSLGHYYMFSNKYVKFYNLTHLMALGWVVLAEL